jgi:3-oxoacyl-[acyl-carrier protein] reductase
MCEKKLIDKVAIVTGAAQGIGKAIGLALANEGAKIVLWDINLEETEKTSKEITQLYQVETSAYKVNVANYPEVEETVKKILDKFSKIDILVNNAGITRDNLILRMNEEEWDQVIAVNLKGVFNCTKAVSRVMLKQHSGKIVNIASVVGLLGNPGQANYSASKGGVIALTKTCAREFAKRNINVNAIAPGFIKTSMTEKLEPKVKETLLEQIPLARLGEPEEVAKLVLFLVSEEANYITGQVVSIDGGMHM